MIDARFRDGRFGGADVGGKSIPLVPRESANLGATYTTAFDTIFPDLAKTHGAALYPFFLDGVAAEPKLNLPDGMHPTADGIDVIVERILPAVEALIERAKTRKG